MNRLILLWILILGSAGQISAQLEIVNPGILYDNTPNLSYCLAEKSSVSPFDTTQFTPRIPTLFEKLEHVVWVKGQFVNRTNEKIVLGILNATIDSLSIYIKGDGDLKKILETGDRYPYFPRQYENEYFLTDLPQSTGIQTFYIRVKLKELTHIPVAIGSPDAFTKDLHKSDLGVALYLGGILILVVYNLFICVSTREFNYLIYALSNSLALLLILTMDGYSFHYLWPSYPQFNEYVPSIAALNSMAYCSFFISFTNLKFYEPRWRIFFICVISFFALLIPLNLLSYNYLASVLYEVGAVPYIFAQVYVTGRVIRYGYTPAKYFFLGTCLYSTGGLLFILFNLNLVPDGFPVGGALKISMLAEACLLSFALADKLNFLKNENIRITTDSNRSLTESNSRLKDALDSLDLFTYRSAHDIRGPLMRLKGLINLISADQRDYPTYVDKLKLTADNMESILDKHIILNTLKNYKVRKSEVKFSTLIEKIGIDLNLHSGAVVIDDEECMLYADVHLLTIVFRELMNNSRHFAQSKESVHIKVRARREGDGVVIYYFDNGTGIDETIRSKIFELFFRGSELSQGSGIGLTIVSEAMALLNGSVMLKDSKPGLTIFEIRIPKVFSVPSELQAEIYPR